MYSRALTDGRRSGLGASLSALGIAPQAIADAIGSGIRQFQVLLPENAERVAAVMYEDYVGVLENGSAGAKELAKFLGALL